VYVSRNHQTLFAAYLPVILNSVLTPTTAYIHVLYLDVKKVTHKKGGIYCCDFVPNETPVRAVLTRWRAGNKRYRVLLSYNDEDREQYVDPVYHMLDANLSTIPWMDRVDLEIGDSWTTEFHRQLKKCHAVLYFVSEHGDGRYQLREFEAIEKRPIGSRPPLIPVLLPGAPVFGSTDDCHDLACHYATKYQPKLGELNPKWIQEKRIPTIRQWRETNPDSVSAGTRKRAKRAPRERIRGT
jgi:hypothetical protein